jgi:hypothetical protein
MQNSGHLSGDRWRTHYARTNSGHLRLCQQPRAAHALRSDQKDTQIEALENEINKKQVLMLNKGSSHTGHGLSFLPS